jgi:hypothetical protein
MEKPNNDLVPLFNPLKDDFSYEWLNDDNDKIVLSIPGREIAYFDKPRAEFLAKHLADAVYNERGGSSNSEEDYREIYKEIYVKL